MPLAPSAAAVATMVDREIPAAARGPGSWGDWAMPPIARSKTPSAAMARTAKTSTCAAGRTTPATAIAARKIRWVARSCRSGRATRKTVARDAVRRTQGSQSLAIPGASQATPAATSASATKLAATTGARPHASPIGTATSDPTTATMATALVFRARRARST